MDLVGLSKQYRGLGKITVSTLHRMVEKFGLKVEYLFMHCPTCTCNKPAGYYKNGKPHV
jgi:hypothetical protein